MIKPIWIIGCGDIGRRLADLYQGKEIHGIVQSQHSYTLCEAKNIKAQQHDFDQALILSNEQFKDANIFYFMPPAPEKREDSRIKKFLKEVGNHPNKIVLISTTGVYGDSKGEWIDETTPVNPIADRAFRRLSAEQQLQDWAEENNKPCMILRVPGIYAKERLPLARLEKGLPIVKASEAGYINRIHADDLAQACKAAMEADCANEIINVTDGNPSTMTDYFNQVADFAKLPRPPQISMQEAEETLSAGMVSYLRESRRIRNHKMLALLKITLKYPDLETTFSKDHT